MLSFSSTFGFKAIFVLVNFGFVALACDLHNAVLPDKVQHLTTAHLVSDKSTIPKSFRFIGDLTIGSGEGTAYDFMDKIENVNPTDYVNETTYHFGVPQGTISHLIVSNYGDSQAAVCSFPDSLGSNTTSFSVRVAPKSTALLICYIGVRFEE